MTQSANKSVDGPLIRSARLSLRLFLSVRWDEVLVLQGTPLVGASFAIPSLTIDHILLLSVFTLASSLLVAHVFVFNDWSGIDGDVRDSNRTSQTFLAKQVSRSAFGVLAAVLLVLSLSLFAVLGSVPLSLAVAIAGLSTLYSAPIFHLKGTPIFNSILHLIGGILHFLLGYAMFAALDARAVAIGVFFGLVFAAGHMMHETRDHGGDSDNGIRTNAVAFGKRRAFLAGLFLFTAAYALLLALAVIGLVPRILVLVAPLYFVHLYMSRQTLKAGLTFNSLQRLQTCYRLLYAIIGMTIVAALWFGHLHDAFGAP